MTATEEDVVEDAMTLTEHLAELRVRIIRAGLAVILASLVIIAFYGPVYDFLVRPYDDLCASKPDGFCSGELNAFSPTEGFSARLRVGMYGGIFIALPVILWQVWRFVVPALESKEKKYAIPFVLSSVVLFCAGGTLAYLTVGRALDFLISWSGSEVEQVFAIEKYFALVGFMVFAFGVGFLLPVLLVFLQLVGVVTPRQLIAGWRYAIVGIFVLAAVITPSGDPITLLTLSVPMGVLYFVAIGIGWVVARRRARVA
ncbi:MAG: sec-independent protein translocase protein TatC [Ilumatobacter sp.]|jgi:sec-independent protein translocase protein TatC